MSRENNIQQGTILVVDDDRINISLIKAILEDYNVLSACDAGDFFAIIEKEIPDIILLDIMMPGIDGMTIARRLKSDQRYREIPIVFLSAVTSAESVAGGFTLGAHDYIRKPFDGAELQARVKRVIENSSRQHELYERATRDSLTGLYNRQFFFEQLDMDIRKWRRNNLLFSLGIMDIDLFKNINDTFGHLSGDRVLKGLASFLERKLRSSDIIARYGGEEFVFIMHDSDKMKALSVMERLRSDLASTEMDSENRIFITISCGICDIGEVQVRDDSAGEMLEIADRRLYIAKNEGRNRVVTEG